MPGRRGRQLDRRLAGAAFACLYSFQSPRLVRFFYRHTFDAQVSLDLVAETFAQALAAREGFRGASDVEVETRLGEIAHNLLSHYQRDGLAERRATEQLQLSVPAIAADDYERVKVIAGAGAYCDRLRGALGGLTEERRRAVELRVIDERPYSEVAHRLGITEAGARARVSRALQVVAAALGDEEPPQAVTRWSNWTHPEEQYWALDALGVELMRVEARASASAEPDPASRSRRRPLVAALVSAAIAALLMLTPPGRALADDIGGLVGVGSYPSLSFTIPPVTPR